MDEQWPPLPPDEPERETAANDDPDADEFPGVSARGSDAPFDVGQGRDDTGQLPHWTAPPTGSIPRALAPDDDDDDDAQAWAALSQGPRWRGDDAHVDDGYETQGALTDDAAAVIPIGSGVDATSDLLTSDASIEREPHEDPRDAGAARRGRRGADAGRAGRLGASGEHGRAGGLRRGILRGSGREESDERGERGEGARAARAARVEKSSGAGRSERTARPEAAASAGGGRLSPGSRAEGAGGVRRSSNGSGLGGVPIGSPLLQRNRDAQQGWGRNMSAAILVGAVLLASFLVLCKIGPGAVMVMVSVVLGVGALEFYDAMRRVGYQPAVLLGVVASVGLVLAAYWRGDGAYPLMLGLSVVFTLLWYLFAGQGERPVPNTAVTMLGVAYVGGLGGFAALLLRSPDGVGLLLGAVLVTVASDVGGLLVGRVGGRTHLAEHVSPSKTVEGLLGGLAFAVAIGVAVAGRFEPWHGVGRAFWLGVVGGLAAPLGDLAESMIKRDLGVKDMGTMLAGHGGVLDRFDGLLFVLPCAYYLARVMIF